MVYLMSAVKKPLGKQTEGRIKSHDIICIHTMVGYLSSTDVMFKVNGYTGTESHFGVGGKWGGDKDKGLDGVVYQWQDTDFEADANLEGAHHVISIETADNAPQLPQDILAWTPKQETAIIDLIVQLCRMYDIPPVLIPDTKPNRRGLAYHAQGCTPNIVPGGEKWSLSRGKVCPGPARTRQFKNVIIPAVQDRLRVTTIEDVIDMQWTDKIKLTEEDARVWNLHGHTTVYERGSEVTVGGMVRYPTLARKIDMKVDKLVEAVNKLVPATEEKP
jgi:hypothetical protein